jgi:hypothetical protein
LSRPADAIVLGFSKAPLLVERSFASLRQLKQEGVLRNIHYVTWDSADIDPFVAPIQAMPEVTVTRVPQPVVEGTPYQKTIVYQINNLEAALALIPEEDTIVLKSRTDFVADVDFLRDKIQNFDLDCEIDTNPAPFGIQMPKPIFRAKIWTPWADASQPFFYEDAAFLGRKDDLRHLVLPVSRTDLEMLETEPCYHYYHIVRFAKAFLPAYPMFKRYLKNFHHITNNQQYRMEMLRHAVKNPYFLFLMIAHAWILHSHFHVDCGEPGDLQFFPNTRNRDTDWSDPTTWNLAFPYDKVRTWRDAEFPGQLVVSITRPFARLMDDRWQDALFSKPIAELPGKTLTVMLEHLARSRDGRLKKLEREFYDDLASFYRSYMKARPEGFIRPNDPPTRAVTAAQMSAASANP